MKKLALITTALVLSLSLWASEIKQEGKRSFEDKAAYRVEYLTIVLDLTDKQASQLKELQGQNHGKVEEIKSTFQPTLDNMKSELKSLRENPSEENREKAKVIREKYKPELEPMRTAMKAEKEKFDKVFMASLSTAQADKYQKLKALKEKYKGQHHKGNMHGGKKPMKPNRQLTPNNAPDQK